MDTRSEAFDVVVVGVAEEAQNVISIQLRDPDGLDLPPWTPGAHLDVFLPSGLIRQYSLCGDPEDRATYRIAVLREDAGRGGSVELHSLPLVGHTLRIRGPRNHFEIEAASSYVFIAGGIGVTPILAMVASLPPDANWRLYYAGRSRSTMAFVDELSVIGGDRVKILPDDEAERLDLDSILTGLDPSAAIYCCGPLGLLKALESRREALAPDAALYAERFVPSDEPKVIPNDPSPDTEFEVELRRSNVVLTVPATRTTLSVVRDVLPNVPYSCEEGYCGSCETRVLEGVPDHRDEILSEEERAASKTMMICVGRSCTPRLVLDL